MGPPEYSKVAIGVTAATGVVLVSFLLLKKFGYQVQSKSGNAPFRSIKKDSGETENILLEKSEAKNSHSADQNLKNENLEVKLEGYLSEENKELTENGEGNLNQSYDGQNQNSFIIIGEEEAKLPDNDNAQTEILCKNVDIELPGDCKKPKKSDRSSDESSYDVIEDDRLEETADEGNNGEGKDSAQNVFEEKREGDPVAENIKPEDESFSDLNETNIVVVEPLDHNVNKKSDTSIYSATVSEQLGFSLNEDMTISEDRDHASVCREKFEDGIEISRKEEDEVTFSILDEDNTLVFCQDVILDDDKSAEGDVSQEQDLSVNNSTSQSGTEEKQLKGTEESNAQAITLFDPILTAASEAKSENAEVGDVPQNSEIFDSTEVAAVISKCQNSPMNISKADIFYLVDLLRKQNPELHCTVLDCLIRVTAFTHNIANIRESGCSEVIVKQVQEVCQAVRSGEEQAEKTLNSVCQVLTNLSMDPKTQEELGDAIPALTNLIQVMPYGDATILSALRPLVNLSSESNNHQMYKQLIPTLYKLLESGTHMAKVQSLKVLINLSLDEDIVPSLLDAKAPSNLIELLDRLTANDLILRSVTMISNIYTIIDTLQLTSASLPLDVRAASPETMYMALTGIDRLPTLRSKVFRLTRHEDEDVVYQASKLYNLISEKST